MTTEKDSEGQSEYRVSGTGALELTKYIRNNLLFGTGYSSIWGGESIASKRGDAYAQARDAVGEVSICFLLFGFGLMGAFLILPLYVILAELFFKLIKLLRSTLIDHLRALLIIIFSIYIYY